MGAVCTCKVLGLIKGIVSGFARSCRQINLLTICAICKPGSNVCVLIDRIDHRSDLVQAAISIIRESWAKSTFITCNLNANKTGP